MSDLDKALLLARKIYTEKLAMLDLSQGGISYRLRRRNELREYACRMAGYPSALAQDVRELKPGEGGTDGC